MAGTLTQYAAQVPDLKRRKVVEIFAAGSPILDKLNFIDLGDAMGYEYNREGSLPGIGFRAINGDYAAQAEGAIVPIKEGTAIMGGPVLTDRQLVGNPDYKAGRVAKKVKAGARFFTRMFFEGSLAADPLAFDGIYRRLGTGPQVIPAGENGGYLDLDLLSELIDRVIGDDGSKVLHMSRAMRRTLGATIRAQGGTQIALTEWAGPLKPKAFDGVPIVPIETDESDAEILGFDETCGSSHVTGSIVCLHYGASEDEDLLQGIARKAAGGLFEIEEQGVRDTTDKALVEGRVGLAQFHGRSVARYRGILEGLSA